MLDRVLDWMGEHPIITVVLFLLVMSGGCTIGINIAIASR